MNFDAFIAGCRRTWPCFDRRDELARSRQPLDRRLADVLGEVPGMATENKLMLLNLAVAQLAPDEVYVEVGCYRGASIVGAARGNAAAKIFACDNFSQFEGTEEVLRGNIARYAPGQVVFFNLAAREFLRRAPWRPARIGAYFFDGGHSFADQFEGLADALPSFADDALVIIDDTNKREARAADALFARMVPGFELVLDLRTPRNHHPTWWNGVQLFRFRRLATTPAALPDPGAPFWVRRLIYDSIALNFKHRRRAFNRRVKEMFRARR
ncbi:MAG TPA: class I SAM-dependent methyltransferase [Candidatus Binataceae bacterium]|nr:class I SAM-dependent methyltransferase [Candidatus Binataceae bacterium]